METSYTLNNPVKYTDPTGHAETCEESCGSEGTGNPSTTTTTTTTTETATTTTPATTGENQEPNTNNDEKEGQTENCSISSCGEDSADAQYEAVGEVSGSIWVFGYAVKSCYLWQRCASESNDVVINVTTNEIAQFDSVGPTNTNNESRDFLCVVLCLSVDFHIGIGTTPIPDHTLREIYGGWFDNRGTDTPIVGIQHSTSETASIVEVSFGPSIPSAYSIPTYATQIEQIWPPPPLIAQNP